MRISELLRTDPGLRSMVKEMLGEADDGPSIKEDEATVGNSQAATSEDFGELRGRPAQDEIDRQGKRPLAASTDSQTPPAQDPAGYVEELASNEAKSDREPTSVTLTDEKQRDSFPESPAPPGHEGSPVGEELGLCAEKIGGPSPSPVRNRGPIGKEAAAYRGPTEGSLPAHRGSIGEESSTHRGAIGTPPGSDSAATTPATDPLSAPAADREVVAEEKPEPAEADIDDDTSPYDPVLWQRLEDLALLVADLQDRTTTNSEVVDQLAEEVEELRGNLLAQDEDPDEVARRLDAVEDKLMEIEGKRELEEASESEQAGRGFPWWVLALAAAGVFAAAIAAGRTPSPPPAEEEGTGGAGAPDIAVPVAAIPEPPTPVAAPGQEFPPAVRRLLEKGYRPDELIWRAD